MAGGTLVFVDNDELTFVKPWVDLRGPVDGSYDPVAQLQREVAPGHPLFEQEVVAIAACGASDDVVFKLEDGRLTLVHLTWKQPVKQSLWDRWRRPDLHPSRVGPPYPETTFFDTPAELRQHLERRWAGWDERP